jgi:translation initiation factor IF-2
MPEEVKTYRLGQAARSFGVTTGMISEFLAKKGHKVVNDPNTKISGEEYAMAQKEFAASTAVKNEASGISIGKTSNENIIISSDSHTHKRQEEEEDSDFFNIKGNYSSTAQPTAKRSESRREPESISNKPTGLKVLGKIELDGHKKTPVAQPQSKVQVTEPVAVPKVETPPVKVAEPVVPEVVVATPPQIREPEVVKAPPVVAQVIEAPVKQEPVVVQEKPVAKVVPPVVETAKVEANPIKPEVNPVVAEIKPPVVAPKVVESAPPVEKEPEKEPTVELIKAEAEKLQGLKVLGKIELPLDGGRRKPQQSGPGQKPVASSDEKDKAKRKRKRIKNAPGKPVDQNAVNNNTGSNQQGGGQQNRPPNNQQGGNNNRPNNQQGGNNRPNNQQGNNNRPNNQNRHPQNRGGAPLPPKEELSEKDIQDAIKNTLARLSGNRNQKGPVKKQIKRGKRDAFNARMEADMQREQAEAQILRVTEFISANEMAALMDVSVNQIISKCLSYGMFVAINQRLDAEAITIIADEFGYTVEFISAEQETSLNVEVAEDEPEDLSGRAPIVTIMGHVDHGKTSLLDYIRKAKVVEGEAGGITQHIGAYDVTTKSGKRIAFLDTPGHEAFTAMRARGAKLTDVAIIVVAADDSVMPQTVEAINHAQVAGVKMVFAINKIDKPDAKPEKIKEALANMNILVEDWGGQYQSQDISAKKGIGIDELLEKVLLEAELLDLKANPDRNATGTVIEAFLDKGKGYVATVMVQNGTLKRGDIILAGAHQGRVKALMDHRGKVVKEAGPATPVQVLGLSGAPQAGDKFNVMDSEREAKEIATKREQILREQSIRATKRTTLTDIGRRIALGNFKQLNLVVKGDVDGSVEALSDALLKLSTEEVEVNIISKGVGQISESDVLLATASDAILIGFQVRPSPNARKVADREGVEIRFYTIIYNAINEVKDAMEGLLAPSIEEVVLGNAEVREVFKIAKVGTVAGCYVTEGHIKRNAKVRVLRDGIVVFGGEKGGEFAALKRFKDDVSEVKASYECGMSIKNFNDLKTGDIIEAFEEKEVKRKL